MRTYLSDLLGASRVPSELYISADYLPRTSDPGGMQEIYALLRDLMFQGLCMRHRRSFGTETYTYNLSVISSI